MTGHDDAAERFTGLRALIAALRRPDTRRLQAAALLTSTADWGVDIALAIYAFKVGGAVAVGTMTLFMTLPTAPAPCFVFCAPINSSSADRSPEIRALPHFTRTFELDKKLLQREQKPGVPKWLTLAAYLAVLAIAIVAVTALAAGLVLAGRQEDRRPDRDPRRPERSPKVRTSQLRTAD